MPLRITCKSMILVSSYAVPIDNVLAQMSPLAETSRTDDATAESPILHSTLRAEEGYSLSIIGLSLWLGIVRYALPLRSNNLRFMTIAKMGKRRIALGEIHWSQDFILWARAAGLLSLLEDTVGM